MKIRKCLFSFLMALSFVFNEPINYRKQLFEKLEISLDAQINEDLYIELVDKLEALEIEEEDLSYGYEFMGGYSGLKSYINKNSKRLLLLMGVEFSDDLKDSNLKISLKESIIDSVDMNDTKLLSRENEKINQENDSRAKIDSDKPDILSLSIYNSTPLILSQTTKAFDRSSAKIYGASVILPYKMERLSRVLEILFKADSGYYNPRMIFELRYYNFEKIISDSSTLLFGGSDYIFIGFHDDYYFNGKNTEFSFLLGKTHFNSLGIILSNRIELPMNLNKMKLKLYLTTKATLLHKVAKNNEYGGGDYTGWVDIGLSLNYNLNINSFISKKGLIKRRQTILK